MSTLSYSGHANGFLARRKASPIGIGGVIAIHAGVAAVVLLMPGMKPIDKIIYFTLPTHAVPPDKPPPEKKILPKQQKPTLQQPMSKAPIPIVPLSNPPDYFPRPADPLPTPGLLDPHPGPIEPVKITPPRVPLFVESRMDPRYTRNLQPDYPPARLREDQEGKVTVRVRIGADGRVLAAELVSATHPDFWRATQEQALRAWRFIPATRDGVAVESERVMTVYFKMQGQ